MPCVFPVLSLKLLSIVALTEHRQRAALAHVLAYTFGILVSCWSLVIVLLVMRQQGNALGWGFQLQSPWFIAGLAILFTLMALNLLDVFIFGSNLIGIANWLPKTASIAQEFGSGVIATVVATPCSAPFVGTAVAAALTAPTGVCLALFSALGLGLALPVLLTGMIPKVTHWLPRPGRWMLLFKQLLAFPLWLTVVWLIYIFGSQTTLANAMLLLAALVLVALTVFALSQLQGSFRLLIAVLAVSGASVLVVKANKFTEIATNLEVDAFSEQAVLSWRRQGYAVLVDFTALWCVTCQINERTVLRDPKIIEALTQHRVKLLKADWTRRDPLITAALKKFERSSVPLVVLYPVNVDEQAVILPEILTRSALLAELERLSMSSP